MLQMLLVAHLTSDNLSPTTLKPEPKMICRSEYFFMVTIVTTVTVFKNIMETKISKSAMLQSQHATMLHVTNVCYVTVKKKIRTGKKGSLNF